MITKYTDTYCTIDESVKSDRLQNNKYWVALSVYDKEMFLKSSSKYIDRIRFDGSKTDPGQAMQFPRDFSSAQKLSDDDLYTTAVIEDRLIQAVCENINYVLSPQLVENYGGNNDSKGKSRNSMVNNINALLLPYRKVVSPMDVY